MKAITTKEEALIRLLKQDSQWAFNHLYQLYAHRLLAFAMEYCHQHETAEEIVQDTFIWIWNHRHDIKQEKTLFNLIFIKTRHLLINAYRATVNSPRFEDYVEYSNRLGTEHVDSQLEYDEFLRIIEQGLKQLPPTQQRVIRLSRLEQKSIKEIAASLNMKEQSVRNQLSLGLKQLMSLISRSGYSVLLALLIP